MVHAEPSDGASLYEKAVSLRFQPVFLSKISENDPGTIVILNKTALWHHAHGQQAQDFAHVDAVVDGIKRIFIGAGMTVCNDAIDSSAVDQHMETLAFNSSGPAHDEALYRLSKERWLQHQPGVADVGTMVTMWPEGGGLTFTQNLQVFND